MSAVDHVWSLGPQNAFNHLGVIVNSWSLHRVIPHPFSVGVKFMMMSWGQRCHKFVTVLVPPDLRLLSCRYENSADKNESLFRLSLVRSETRNKHEVPLIPRPLHHRPGGHGKRRPSLRSRKMSAETSDCARFRSGTGTELDQCFKLKGSIGWASITGCVLSTRLPNPGDMFWEFCVCKVVASHLRRPKNTRY